jgi:hypothetical protein
MHVLGRVHGHALVDPDKVLSDARDPGVANEPFYDNEPVLFVLDLFICRE